MVIHDVSDNFPGRYPGTLLVARLHIDLCRIAGALERPPRGTATGQAPCRAAARV